MNAAPLFCFEDVCDWLQQATLEIFQSTFELPALVVPAPPSNDLSEPLVASSTSFSGAFAATLVIATKNPSAALLASRMLDIPEPEVRPENTDDVIKELGNMILGAVKSRISDLGTDCSMGIPQSADWISSIAQEGPVSEDGQMRRRIKFSFEAGELLLDFVLTATPPGKNFGTPPR